MAIIKGTKNSDFINGTAGADTIRGLGGADTLNGLDGDDLIYGGDSLSLGLDGFLEASETTSSTAARVPTSSSTAMPAMT
jgi:Ca2+-binding RTX toxin-like protein